MRLSRGIEPVLHNLLDTTKIVVLEGGRGVGKTTLAQEIAEKRQFQTLFDLSDPADRAVLEADAHRVLAASPKPVLIDEAQLVAELPVAVKRVVDSDPANGQFLLTGSSRIGRGALGGADPLAGRAVRLRLRPFTQAELAGTPANVISRWWSKDFSSEIYPELPIDELHSRITRGGLPPIAIEADPADEKISPDIQRRILANYIDGVLTTNIAGTRTRQAGLLKTFNYLASNPSQILNLSRAASELQMRVETVQNYLDICQTAFLIDTVPAHRPGQHQTVAAHPRLYIADTAIASWAAETTVERLRRDVRLSGAMVENFVVNELAAQAEWVLSSSSLLHWRDTRAGKEVDVVLRKPTGELLAIEIKSAASVTTNDTRGLVAFADRVGDQLVGSCVIYTGRVTQQLDSNIWAVPLSSFFNATSVRA